MGMIRISTNHSSKLSASNVKRRPATSPKPRQKKSNRNLENLDWEPRQVVFAEPESHGFVDLYLQFLRIERGLAQNSVDAYGRDLAKFEAYLKPQSRSIERAGMHD